MSLLSKACFALANPIQACYLLQQKISPRSLLERGSRLACRAGLTRPTFILSFDCDTDKDIRVGWDVHSRLTDIGIMPVYAVPGELLEKGADVYGCIAETGAEFLNHGHVEHTRLDEAAHRYTSTVFYDRLSRDEVRADVINGHETVERVLGVKLQGFRTPHFGTFQRGTDLRFLHGVLKELGYRYSSSTVPYYGLRYGPMFEHFGLAELPVSGCADHPLMILDTYTFRYSGNPRFSMEMYVRQVETMAAFMGGEGRPFLLNIYADPSQVHDWPEFFDAMRKLAAFNVKSFLDLLKEMEK